MRLVLAARDERRASPLRERARLLGAHPEGGEGRDDAAIDIERFGREVEFEIGVGKLDLGDGRLVRHLQRGVASARAF